MYMYTHIYTHSIFFLNIRMNDLVVVLHDVWLSIVAQHLTFRVSAEGLSFVFMFELSLRRSSLSMD